MHYTSTLDQTVRMLSSEKEDIEELGLKIFEEGSTRMMREGQRNQNVEAAATIQLAVKQT